MRHDDGAGHPRELLSAYLDGAVSEAERSFVEAHLATCEACRGLLEDLRAVLAAIPALEVPPVPQGLAARIAEAMPAPRRRFRLVLPLSAAATLAAVALLTTVTLHQRSAAPAQPPALAEEAKTANAPAASPPPSPRPPQAKKQKAATAPRRDEPEPEAYAPAPPTVAAQGGAAPPEAGAASKDDARLAGPQREFAPASTRQVARASETMLSQPATSEPESIRWSSDDPAREAAEIVRAVEKAGGVASQARSLTGGAIVVADVPQDALKAVREDLKRRGAAVADAPLEAPAETGGRVRLLLTIEPR